MKQIKTSRFDIKPTVERVENGVDQNMIPNLSPGEYALIFRNPSASGDYTANVALQPATNAGPVGMSTSKPALTSASPFGMLRRGLSPGMPPPAPAASPAQAVCGFLAWDFRIVRGM